MTRMYPDQLGQRGDAVGVWIEVQMCEGGQRRAEGKGEKGGRRSADGM